MRRSLLFCCTLAGLLGSLGVVVAQNPGPSAPPPDPNSVKLVGDRFKPLTYREMNPEQKKMFESLISGERRGAGGPFNVLLRSPEMGDLAQKFGASMRFHSSIPSKLNEMGKPCTDVASFVCHSTLPLVVSMALKVRSRSPTNATPPAVDSTDVRNGARCCSAHVSFKLLTSNAASLPMFPSVPGIS